MPRPDQASRTDAERNHRQLLDAALTVLRDDPAASMEDIARGAGLTRVTLYRHFGGREKLLDAIRDDALTQAAEAVQDARLGEGPALEALTRFVGEVTARGERFRFLLADGADLPPEFRRRRREILAPLQDTVRRGQTAGEIRADLPAEWVAATLASLLTTAVGKSGLGAGRGAELVVTTLAHGVAAR